MQNILIIEDDRIIRNELKIFLEKYDYNVLITDDFKNIISFIKENTVHLILLDINLPIYDGYYICREIRKDSNVPIIVVTSRNNDVDELMSMNLGADDFITKPYNTQILLARMESILSRVYNQETKNITHYEDLELNMGKGTLACGEKVVELTKNEIRIVSLLMKNKQVITSRDALMNELWQSDEFVDDNTLTVNVNRLRKKLEEIGAENMLKTKRGQGYLLCK